MLTFTEFSGSPYQVGLALGRFGAEAIHTTVMSSPAWERAMQWRDHEHVLAMQEQVKVKHPYIWDELQGLARGLELPPDDVFAWNVRTDLPDYVDADPTMSEAFDAESATVLLAGTEGARIVHRQGGDAHLLAHCGIAQFRLDPAGEFAAFVCPGMLPGSTFGVTSNGLAMAVNLMPAPQVGVGVPSIVLCRALLEAPDLSSAVKMLNQTARAGQAHIGLGLRGGTTLLSIEFNPETVSVQAIKPGAVHTNHLVHEDMLEQPRVVMEPSRQHYNEANALLQMGDNPDPMDILGKSAHLAATLAWADMQINADEVLWSVYTAPDAPVRFQMRDARHI